MAWLDRVTHHDGEGTACEAIVRADSPLADARGRVPGVAAIEWMAQCAAVHAALALRAAAARGTTPPAESGADATPAESGASAPPAAPFARVLLLGTRLLALERAFFAAGERVVARARPAAAATSGLVAFDAELADATGAVVARARLNLMAERAAPRART